MTVSPRKAIRIIGGNHIEKPTFEASAVELLAIKRFVAFALADVKYEFDEMNRQPGLSRDHLEDAQTTAVLLSNYLSGLRGGLEAMQVKLDS